jgi:hypothetical protein
METTVQAVAPTVAAGWGGMLGGWVGGSYQRVRRFIADHRKGLSTCAAADSFWTRDVPHHKYYPRMQGCCAWR